MDQFCEFRLHFYIVSPAARQEGCGFCASTQRTARDYSSTNIIIRFFNYQPTTNSQRRHPSPLPHITEGIIICSSAIIYQYKIKLTSVMSRSQPKPKIIFKTLEDLIKTSSLSKKNPQEHFSSHTLPLRSVTEASTQSLKRSSSKQSVQSKEKLNSNIRSTEKSFERSSKNLASISYDSIQLQIGKVYDEMQAHLHLSKERVLSELKSEKNSSVVEAKVKELQKMSDYLKHIIEVFTNQTSEFHINQKKILKDSTKENQPIEKLSRNQKKKANCRFVSSESQKKPSVYEMILNRLN